MSEKPILLCIDDDERTLRSLETQFRRTHEVLTTSDPEEFKSLLNKHDVHVVISDQRMPNVSGTDLLQFAKENSTHTARILLTGYADSEAIVDSINDSEIFQYVQKPWDLEKMNEIVHQATELAQVEWEAVPVSQSLLKPQFIFAHKDEDKTLAFYHRFQDDYDITCVNSVETLYKLIESNEFAVALIDLQFKQDDLFAVIRQLKTVQPLLLTIVMTEDAPSDELINFMNTHKIFRCLCECGMDSDKMRHTLEDAIVRYNEVLSNPELQLHYLMDAIE